MSICRSPLKKKTAPQGGRSVPMLYLRREGAGERCDLFVVHKVLGDGGSTVCYEALLTDEKKLGRLKEFYPVGASCPFSLARTAENHVVSTDKHLAFAHAREEFLAPWRLLRDLMQTHADLAGFIPDFSIYYPCLQDGTPVENGTVYIFTAPESMLVFSDLLASIRRAPTETPERTLYTILSAVHSLTECVRILHEQGLLHLDIKPANFGIPRRGDRLLTDTVSLFDLDSLQSLSARELICHATKGFAAPEVLSGRPSNRSDIYAIGCTLFSAIVVHKEIDPDAGYHPAYYHRLSELIAESALFSASEINSNVFLEWELVRILEKCLAPHESGRYRNCGELLSDLTQACNRLLTSTVPNPTGAVPPKAELVRRLGKKQGPGAMLSMLYHLYKHPLTANAPQAKKTLDLLLVGCGSLGQLFLDCALSLAQCCGRQLSVRVLSADHAIGKRDKELYLMRRPALADFFEIDDSTVTPSYGHICFSHAEFIPGDLPQNIALARETLRTEKHPDYIFVALGDDAINRSVALAYVSATSGARGCRIHYAHAGVPCERTDRAIPLNLAVSFAKDPAFAVLEQMALNAHICWKNGADTPLSKIKEEFRSPYFYLSSLTYALSVQYKLEQLGIHLQEPCQAADAFRLALSQGGRTLLGELVAAEHRRWITEKLCDGFTPLTSGNIRRDLRKKQHVCLVHAEADLTLADWSHDRWDHATDADLSPLDPLDRVSVERHLSFLAQAEQIRTTVSPASMHPVLQLRALCDRTAESKRAFSEWYTCLSRLWDKDAQQARSYPARCEALLQVVCSTAPQSSGTAQKLLALINEQTAPLLRSMDYLNYKQNDMEMVERIPFILTYRTDLHLAIPLHVGSASAHFENVAAATVCKAAQITYLFHLSDGAMISSLLQALQYAANYKKAHGLYCKRNLLLTYDPKAVSATQLAALRTDLHASGMPHGSVSLLAGTAQKQPEHVLYSALKRKRSSVLLEQNATPLSTMLSDADIYRLLPSYRFDSRTRRFTDTHDCDLLTYLKTDAYLRAFDLLPTHTEQPALPSPLPYTAYTRLWQALYRPHTDAWRALCNLLRDHCSKADIIATLPPQDKNAPRLTRRLLLPASAFAGAEKVVTYLRNAGALDSTSSVCYQSAEICSVFLSAPADTLAPLELLFAKPHLLLQADALTLTRERGVFVVRSDELVVDKLSLENSTVPAAELALLLDRLAKEFSLLTALRAGDTADVYAFTFASRSVKALLTAEERLALCYIGEICKQSDLFDDIALNYETDQADKNSTNQFDILLTKGFSSLIVDVKARDEDMADCQRRLAALVAEHGIHSIPVLIACDAERTPIPDHPTVVTITDQAEIDQIALTLARLLP